MPARRIEMAVDESVDGWIARVTVAAQSRTTTHIVRVSRAELDRYGGGEVGELLRRSLEFLLDREPNTQILREFDISAIERYFPEYAAAMKR